MALNEGLWCLGAGLSEWVTAPTPAHGRSFRAVCFFAKPLFITWRVWDVSEHRPLMGGESHGSTPVVLAPSFISSLSQVASHAANDAVRGGRSVVGKPPGGGHAGDRVVQLRHSRLSTKPTPAARPVRLRRFGPAARQGQVLLGAGGEGLRPSAAGAFESPAAGGNEKPP